MVPTPASEVLEEAAVMPNASRRQTVRAELRELVASIALAEPGGRDVVALPGPRIQLLIRERTEATGGLGAYVVGAHSVTRRKPAPQTATLVVRFAPGCAATFVSLPLSTLADRIVPLEDVWREGAQPLIEALSSQPDTEGRVRILQDALLAHMQHTAPEEHRVRAAARRACALLTHSDGASVATVASRLGVSQRHLRRMVRGATGLSPIRLLRALRLRRAVALASAPETRGWAWIAVAAGYYDQAHMIHEFRDLAGATPPTLLAELAS